MGSTIRAIDDRLLLGMKGTMRRDGALALPSALARSPQAEGPRGELFLTVAVGYCKVHHDRIEKDQTVGSRRRSRRLFQVRRAADGSAGPPLDAPRAPAFAGSRVWARGPSVTWKLPVYNTLHHMLTNPIYAGAYAFGRTGSRVTIEAGRKRIVRGFRKDPQRLEALILDHHEGYVAGPSSRGTSV